MKQKFENWLRLAELLRVEIPKKSGVHGQELGDIKSTITDLKIFHQYIANHQDPHIRTLPLKQFLDDLLEMPLGRGRVIKGRYFGGSKQKELAKHLIKLTSDLRQFSQSNQSESIFERIVTESNAFTTDYPELYNQMKEHVHYMLNTMQFLTLSQLHHVKSSPVQFKEEYRLSKHKIQNLQGEFISLMDNDLEYLLIERGFAVNGLSSQREQCKSLVETIDKKSILFSATGITYKLKDNSASYTIQKTKYNAIIFERIEKKESLAGNHAAKTINKQDLIDLLLSNEITQNPAVTTIPMISSFLDEAILSSIAQNDYKTRALVLIPNFTEVDNSVAGKIDIDTSKDPEYLFKAGITEGHWAYLHIEHSKSIPPEIITIRLDDAKKLSNVQKEYIGNELKKLSHSKEINLPEPIGLEGGVLTDNWSGGYHALASLLVQAEQDKIFFPKKDPVFNAAKKLKSNEAVNSKQPIEQLAKKVFKDLKLKVQHTNVNKKKFAPISVSPARLQDESAIIILAELIGSCITRLKNGHALTLSYEGEGPGRTAKDINRERLSQESAMFVLNKMKQAYVKKNVLHSLPNINTKPSTPYDLWRTNYIVSRPIGQEKLGIVEVDDKDVPEIPSLVRDYAPRELPQQEQAQSQYTDEGAYEGSVNIVNGHVVENMSTHGAFVSFPRTTRMSELPRTLKEGETRSIFPSNLLARGVKSLVELKPKEHAPVHFRRHSDVGFSDESKHLIGYVHGMVSAIPKALEMQWEGLVAIGKEMFSHLYNPNKHGIDFLMSLNSEQRAQLINTAIPKLLDTINVSITEVLIGNCTTKTSSCYGCTSYINALGLTPSASHLGGSYSWIPPIPQMPPFENASPIMQWILPELYKKYCHEMEIYLKTGVDAIEAYIQEGHRLGATQEEHEGLAQALLDLKTRLSTGTAEQATAFYLDALTVHKKTVDRPLNILPRESTCAKIAFELALLLKEPRKKILKIQSGKINLKSYINSKNIFDIQQAIVLAQVNSNTKPQHFKALLEELSHDSLKGKEYIFLIQALQTTPLDLVCEGPDFRKAGTELFTRNVVKWLCKHVPKFSNRAKYAGITVKSRQTIMQEADEEAFSKAIDYALSQNSFYIEEAFLQNNLTKKEKKPVNMNEIKSGEKIEDEYYTLRGNLRDVGRRLRSDFIVDPMLNQRMESQLQAKGPEIEKDSEKQDLMFLKINVIHRKIDNIANARNMMDTLMERVAVDILQMWYPRFNEPSDDKKHYDEHLLKLNRVDSKLPETFADVIKAQIKINAEIEAGKTVKSQFGNVLKTFPMHQKFAQYQYALYGNSTVTLPPLAQLGTHYQFLTEYYQDFPVLLFKKNLNALNANKNKNSALFQRLQVLFERVKLNASHLDDYCLSQWSELFKELNRELERTDLDKNGLTQLFEKKYKARIENLVSNMNFQVNSASNKVTSCSFIGSSLVAAPFNAVFGGINGMIGRSSISFFNPIIASTAGSFGTFAVMGALTLPLVILPSILIDHAFKNSTFLSNYPKTKDFLHDSATLLTNFAAISTAALVMGLPPFGITVLCMMVVPTLLFVLKQICNVVHDCLNKEAERTAPSLS